MDQELVFRVLLDSVNEFSGRDYTPGDIDRSRPVFDYGVDSLNIMQILAEVEDALDLEVDLSRLSEAELVSIDSFVDYLESLRKTVPESV
jgi:acyl carrier protein